MDFERMTLGEFSQQLASKAAVPGGGGASALVASLGASLALMVGNLTLGKKKYEANEPELRRLMDEAETLRTELLDLIEKDAEVFTPLAEAYSIPKDKPGRDYVMENCLAAAASVPMRILELSCRVIELQQGFAALGSKMAVSDAGTGLVFAWGAMYGAALNVLVNTHSMKDRDTAEKMNSRVKELMDKYWQLADKTYEDVFTMLS